MPGKITITIREYKEVPVLDINGEVDLYNAKEIKDMLDNLIKEEKYHIIVNLAEVPFIDSSGIGTLVTGMYRLKKYQGDMRIINPMGSVAKVFMLTGMDKHLELSKTEEDAYSSFGL